MRPETGDALFFIRPTMRGADNKSVGTLLVYRVALDDEGPTGPVTPFADLSSHYEPDEAEIDFLTCQPGGNQVLVTVGRRERMMNKGWWSELWLLGDDGSLARDSAFGRDIGPAQVAWSPDGLRLLLEANPMKDAGSVYLYELDTDTAVKLEGGLEVPAGAGGGTLYWTHGGHFAQLMSIIISNSSDHAIISAGKLQTFDVTGPVPKLVSDRELDDLIADAVDPSGGIVYAAALRQAEGAGALPYGLYRLDPSGPSTDPVMLGRFALSVDQPERIGDLALLPPNGAEDTGPRAVVTAYDGESYKLLLVDMSTPGATEVWQLSPVGMHAMRPQVVGDRLVFMTAPSTNMKATPADVPGGLTVISLASLTVEKLAADGRFSKLPVP